MDKKVEAAFVKFSERMLAADMTLQDLLDVQVGFMQMGCPLIAVAFTSHMRDASGEGDHTGAAAFPSVSALLTEGYRRTFCDPQYADKYFTEEMSRDPNWVVGLLNGLTDGLTVYDQCENKAQLALTLDADTQTAH